MAQVQLRHEGRAGDLGGVLVGRAAQADGVAFEGLGQLLGVARRRALAEHAHGHVGHAGLLLGPRAALDAERERDHGHFVVADDDDFQPRQQLASHGRQIAGGRDRSCERGRGRLIGRSNGLALRTGAIGDLDFFRLFRSDTLVLGIDLLLAAEDGLEHAAGAGLDPDFAAVVRRQVLLRDAMDILDGDRVDLGQPLVDAVGIAIQHGVLPELARLAGDSQHAVHFAAAHLVLHLVEFGRGDRLLHGQFDLLVDGLHQLGFVADQRQQDAARAGDARALKCERPRRVRSGRSSDP